MAAAGGDHLGELAEREVVAPRGVGEELGAALQLIGRRQFRQRAVEIVARDVVAKPVG